MPAKSLAQRRMMAIAEHHPEKLKAKNRGVLSMSKGDLHDFASTSEKNLPEESPVKAAMKKAGRRKKKS